MASPLQPAKPSVDLAQSGVRVSRIRRDPPPPVKEITVRDVDDRDAWVVVIGVATFALALFVITLGISAAAGWSPRQYTIQIEAGDRQ